jgi:hypothetical protein
MEVRQMVRHENRTQTDRIKNTRAVGHSSVDPDTPS